jgi:hypothetical protein
MKQKYYAATAESITALARRIMDTNLCKEIILPKFSTEMMKISSKSKYTFTRKWFIADFDPQYYFEVEAWCEQNFGKHPAQPDAWSRWMHKYESCIHFRDEKDYNWFVLRWGA